MNAWTKLSEFHPHELMTITAIALMDQMSLEHLRVQMEFFSARIPALIPLKSLHGKLMMESAVFTLILIIRTGML